MSTIVNPLPKLISATATRSTVAGSQIDCSVNGRELIQIDVVGGSVPSDFTYEVSIDGAAYALLTASAGTPYTYSALTAGKNYQFRITDNVTGCSILSNAYFVPLFNKINVVASAAKMVSCNAGSNGAIEINVTGYSGTYDYEILKGGVSLVPPITGSGDSSITSSLVLPQVLIAGNDYTVSVLETAFPSCPAVSNLVIITEPSVLDLSAIITVVNQNCNNLGAVITVPSASVTGGTSGYTYAFVPSGTPPAGQYSPSNTKTIVTGQIAPFFDAIDVYVQDANLCTDMQTVNISVDPMPTVTATVASQCANPAGYTINVVGTGVSTVLTPLEYSLDGNSFQTATSFVVKSPGDYTVTVRDANKCKAQSTVVTIFEPLQLQAIVTTTPTCLTANGVVTLTASGGTMPASYGYSDDGITYSSAPNANVFGSLAPGTYTFYVKDIGTNCPKSVTVVIETPNTDIDFSLTKTNVTCDGNTDGSITVALANPTLTKNNNPVYTYSINPPAGTLVGNVFKNLPANTYTITVTSGKGCQVVSLPITVSKPAPIAVPAPVVTEFGCTTGNGNNYAKITVGLPTGGSNVFPIYEFIKIGNPIPVQRGDNPIYIETDLLGGSYVVNVYDTKGCLGTNTATINPFIGIDFAAPSAVTVTNPITCVNTEDIQVNVTFTGGAPVPLVYTIVATVTDPILGTVGNAIPYPTVSNPSGQFTNLTVGSYNITVTNPITGCSLKTIHYVNEPNTFDIVASNVKNVVCYGTATGSVDLTFVDNQLDPINNAGAFSYDITGPINGSFTSAGAGPITISNLPVGVYTVKAKLTALPSCEVETTFTIEQPLTILAISETHTPITCNPGNDGTISVTADGGWPGSYQYELVGPISVAYSTQTDFTNLTAGLYTLNVKDANGCIETATVDLKIPTPIVVTASATVSTLLCNGDTSGVIVVNPPTGGQGSNYSYILNYVSANPAFSLAPQTSPVFSGLSAGTYSVTVVDGLECISQPTADIVIGEPAKVQASLVLATAITCQTAATLTLSATGGTGPYEYSTDKNFAPGSIAVLTSAPFSVGLGDHQYYVRDANGCVSFISNNVTINALTPLSLDLDLSNAIVNCKGSATGVIDANAVGGLADYKYTLLDAAKNPIRPVQVTGYFDLLPAGSYYVRVDSGDCQFDSVVITITEPMLALSSIATPTAVTCNGIGNGKLEIVGTGGTGVLGYAISPNMNQYFDTGTFINLKPGVYDIITQDKNGCFVKDQAIITEPNLIVPTVVASSIQQELCDGEKTGAFDITVVGGIGPYSTSIDGDAFVPNRTSFAGLSGGSHLVIVKDANLCESEMEVALDKAVILDPEANIIKNVLMIYRLIG